MARRVGGRPGRLRRDASARRRMRSRCHLRIVSGETIRCSCRSVGVGSRCRSAARSARSAVVCSNGTGPTRPRQQKPPLQWFTGSPQEALDLACDLHVTNADR